MKFIEGFITDPYSTTGRVGLVRYAKARGIVLSHPISILLTV